MAHAVNPGISNEAAQRKRPNRVAVSALISVSLAIGVLPYAMFVGRWQVLLLAIVAVGGFLLSMAGLRATRSVYSEKPAIGEYALAGWSSLSLASTVSFVGIGIYWITGLVLRFVAWAAGWLDAVLEPNPEFWGFWVSLILVAFTATSMTLVQAAELAEKLFPNTAGVRSAYYSLLEEGKRVTWAAVATGVALIVLPIAWAPPGRSFAIALAVLLFYSGAAISSMSRSTPRVTNKKRILGALSKILRSIGYDVVQSPRTGDPSVDPLITTVDLLAHSPRRALVIEIKAPKESRPVEWHEAAALRKAARKLQVALWESDSVIEVLPVLVLVGRPRAESLRRYLEDEAMEVLEPEGVDWIEQAQSEVTVETLEALAKDLHFERVDPYPVDLESSTGTD